MKLFWAYPMDIDNLKNLPLPELKKHAAVSWDNGCPCLTDLYRDHLIKLSNLCFCCQCLVFHKYEANIALYDYGYDDKEISLYKYLTFDIKEGE